MTLGGFRVSQRPYEGITLAALLAKGPRVNLKFIINTDKANTVGK